MAEVQLALQRGPAGFEKLVVVKLVHENLATQKAFVDMLLDEARIAALVKHPNVVDIYDLGEAEGRYFIAMEYLEGEPLLAVLRAGRDGQRLDVLSTARLIADTAEGLDAAHELRSMAGDPIELVHHDVSLGNIVVLYTGQVKLVDFGVAKATQSATASTKIQGKFSYMAPEKLRGGPGDRRSDIWSLGCVLWEALTLKRLFKGGNDSDTMAQVLDTAILAPSAVNGDVPADFDPIAMRSLERDPNRRYPTAKAMAAEIEEVLRKHGYAAKNDMIARYMQATFESHIAARKKLLQEVSSKGRASPDVLEAAFHNNALASGSLPSPGELMFKPRPVAVAAAEHTPSPAGAGDHGSVPARGTASARELRAWANHSAKLAGPGVDEATRLEADHEPGSDTGDTEVEARQDTPSKRWLAYPIAAGAILAVLVVTSLVVGRARPATSGPAPADPLQLSPGAEPAAIVSAAEPHGDRPAPPAVAAPDTDGAPPATTPRSTASRAAATAPPPSTNPPVAARAAPAADPPMAANVAHPTPTTAPPPGAAPRRDAAAPPPAVAPRRAEAPPPAVAPRRAEAPPPEAPPPPAATPPPVTSVELVEIEPEVTTAKPPRSPPRHPAPRAAQPTRPASDKINPDEVFRAGLQAWVRGDTKTALASYKRVLQANPTYSAAWRNIGLVYERLGDKSAAHAAFQKYLQLAPGATDAPGIRMRLESP
jgi:serine/threonine-protein kinase